jgi:hypothetical protein
MSFGFRLRSRAALHRGSSKHVQLEALKYVTKYGNSPDVGCVKTESKEMNVEARSPSCHGGRGAPSIAI